MQLFYNATIIHVLHDLFFYSETTKVHP